VLSQGPSSSEPNLVKLITSNQRTTTTKQTNNQTPQNNPQSYKRKEGYPRKKERKKERKENKMSTTVPTTRPPPTTTTITPRPRKTYLLIYNALSLTLWASILLILLLPALLTLTPTTLPASPTTLPRIRWTQTLALLEVLHAALGLVRANPGTTAMQVASRLLLVWGVVYAFGEGGAGGHGRAWEGMGMGGARAAGGAGLFAGGGAAARELQMVGSGTVAWAYAGMLLAWCCSEVVRYGYFVVVLAGGKGEGGEGRVPGWLLWLRLVFFCCMQKTGRGESPEN